jgi:hypothetical protein
MKFTHMLFAVGLGVFATSSFANMSPREVVHDAGKALLKGQFAEVNQYLDGPALQMYSGLGVQSSLSQDLNQYSDWEFKTDFLREEANSSFYNVHVTAERRGSGHDLDMYDVTVKCTKECTSNAPADLNHGNSNDQQQGSNQDQGQSQDQAQGQAKGGHFNDNCKVFEVKSLLSEGQATH